MRSCKPALVVSRPRSLPLDQWPDADRDAWNVACRPAVRLRRGGAAAHLRQVTREDLVLHYGNFLGFLDRSGFLRSDLSPAANVTLGNVEAYIAELQSRVSSVTVHGSIDKVRWMAKIITPGQDLTWLSEIGTDLAAVARPKSKFNRLVHSEVLLEAGLTLICEAENSKRMTELTRACQVRKGFMIALYALCPIRRKNFAALEIGRSFVKIKGQWWIVLTAAETKEKRADERPIDHLLTPYIERYLDRYRPVLFRSPDPPPFLWLSARTDSSISAKQVANVIAATTLATVGVKLRPHMFRVSAASTAAIYGGKDPYFGAAVLHHSDPRITIEHYNRATSLSAGESFRQLVRQYEKPD
jgi:site-specific recombinase XerD